MRKTVETLINNEALSLYKIAKESGVPYSTLNDLKNGKSTIDNAKFGTVEKLYNYALSITNER